MSGIRTRPLGNTGIQVSEIALGTVELGMDYGFRGGSHYHKPDRAAAIRLVRHAVERGVNLIDTAGVYGEAESIIGMALREMPARPLIATKFTVEDGVEKAIDSSLRALGVETLDLLQIHYATPEILRRGEVMGALEQAIRAGKVRFAGASVYSEEAAALALDCPVLRTLQVPFNFLDRKMEGRVFPLAASRGVGVLARSAFLRGVLTEQVERLPAELAPLRDAALRAAPPAELAETALRFCLSSPEVSSVLVGIRSMQELDANLAAAARGPLDSATLSRLRECSLGDHPLLSPLNWAGLI